MSELSSLHALEASFDLQEFLRDWLTDEFAAGGPMLLLQGAEGCGKTIACQQLLKGWPDAEFAPARQAPLYLNLGQASSHPTRAPYIHEVIEECMIRGWHDHGKHVELKFHNFLEFAKRRSMIFDNIDDILGDMVARNAAIFLEEFFRLHRMLPEARMLLVCRPDTGRHLQNLVPGRTTPLTERIRAVTMLPWDTARSQERLSGHA